MVVIFEFREDLMVQIIESQRKSSCLSCRHVKELRSSLIYNVVVANQLSTFLLLRNYKILSFGRIAYDLEPNANYAGHDENQLIDFSVFFANVFAINVAPWNESVRNSVENERIRPAKHLVFSVVVPANQMVEDPWVVGVNVHKHVLGHQLLLD